MIQPENITLYIDLALLAFLLVLSLAVILTRNLLVAGFLFGMFSLVMALAYLAMGAPDVAMTEAAIGGGIGTILLLAALLLVGEQEKRHKSSAVFPLLALGLIGVILAYAMLGLPPYGASDSPAAHHLSVYYLQHAEEKTGITNVVTAILASYRGFDTLGEVIVIFTAGMAVMMLLRSSRS